MIEANELRIGNWVDSDNGFSKVIGIDNSEIWVNEYDHGWEPEELTPIDITPEILEKCGFVDNIQMLKPINLLSGRERFHIGKNDDYATIVCGRAPNLVWLQFPCKNLHQLQNLYFALTGTELEINL